MRFWRRWRARRALVKQGICPRHFVKMQDSEWETIFEHFMEMGLLIAPSITMFSTKRKCDLCQIEKRQKEKMQDEYERERAIRELSQPVI